MPNFHDFTMTSIEGEPVALSAYRGKVCLVVNVASN
jgi:glutathione peroxidase-family protein